MQPVPLENDAFLTPVPGRWSAERANAWYDALPWLVGCNYIPATAINAIEMWQASTYDAPTIGCELALARETGTNTLRVYLHDLLHADDAEGLYGRMDEFLQACSDVGIRPMFVFFDDCHYGPPTLGDQPEPVHAWHNSGWLASPAKDVAVRYADGTSPAAEVDRLRRYVQETMRRFGDDERVLLWELYNEPGRGEKTGTPGREATDVGELGERSNRLLFDAWTWAREVAPSQPICSSALGSVGEGNIHISRINSDVHSIHCYGPPKPTLRQIRDYQQDGRPILMTEWLARSQGNTVRTILPMLKRERVAAINWGIVIGKTQTHYAWFSRQQLDDEGEHLTLHREREARHFLWPGEAIPEPPLWFHDLYRADHTPCDADEIACFRELTTSR
ncbi:MAG: 1,4-beta-xylanase [Planctomycetota bacterium]